MSTTAMWLLLAVVVILILFFSVLYKRRFTVHELALTGVMAALSLVAYLFFRIPFYGGSSFHLGNTFTALTALLLDGEVNETISQRAAKDILDRAGVRVPKESRSDVVIRFAQGAPPLGMPESAEKGKEERHGA